MRKLKGFFKKILSWLKSDRTFKFFTTALLLVFSSGGIVFSYLFGSTTYDAKVYSALMTIDAKTKSQKLVSYLHGYLEFNKSINAEDQYKTALDFQHKTIYKGAYYSSYLVSSSIDGIKKYSVNARIPNTNLTDATIAMVRNFWDKNYMESLSLPLFFVENEDGKNNIKAKNANAEFGSYISSSHAYELVSKNGMLENNNGDIKKAFTELLNETDYFYELTCNEEVYSFSVNNIYIDSNFTSLLTEKHKLVSSDYYGHFYKDFSYWNNGAIITYSPTIFIKGSTFCFDLRKNYNNARAFIHNVTGDNFIEKGIKFHFQNETENLEELSKIINSSKNNSINNRNVYFVLALILFETTAIIHFISVSLINKETSNKKRFIKYTLPLFPFILIQLIGTFYLLFSKNYFNFYLSLSYIGNIIIIVFMVCMLVSAYCWRLLND